MGVDYIEKLQINRPKPGFLLCKIAFYFLHNQSKGEKQDALVFD